jgi:DNA-binding LacI/PurR family transcriptional regulator
MDPVKRPLYQYIFSTLRERIVSGVYPRDSYLPSEKTMCLEFKVHRITVRKALDLLLADGLIEKRPGKGTLVREKPSLLRIQRSVSEEKYVVFMLCTGESGDNRFTELFQSGLFYHLERRCAEVGYHLLYKTVTGSDHVSDVIKGFKAAYFIFSSYVFEHLLVEASDLHIPALIVNHQDPRFTSVRSDDFSAAAELVAYFIATGHHRIAALTGPQSYVTSRDRLDGWKSVLRNHSINYKAMPIYEGDWTFISGYKAGKKILQLPESDRPDGVFAFNDESAIGMIKALQEGGLLVPRDISIAGFDDISMCTMVNPALTTIRVDIETIATAVIQQLYFALQLSGENPVIHIKVPAWLTIRDSVMDRRLPQGLASRGGENLMDGESGKLPYHTEFIGCGHHGLQ